MLHVPAPVALLTYMDQIKSQHGQVIACPVKCEINCPFPIFNGCIIEAWEGISNFIPAFIVDVITYLCKEKS